MNPEFEGRELVAESKNTGLLPFAGVRIVHVSAAVCREPESRRFDRMIESIECLIRSND
jgi:hypothetical protein